MDDDTFDFDVALSFAGEDRDYVTEVAQGLKATGVKYFLDSEYLIDTWGEDLVEYFDGVYRKRSRFAVLFISRHYAEKEWPRSERRSALARALSERGAYVLPVRLDDTDVDGLRPTVGYIDSRRIGIDGLIAALVAKLSGRSSGPAGWPGDRTPRGEREIAAVIAEKPPLWELLAFAGLLLAGRDELDMEYRDHLLRYAEPTGEAISNDEAAEWFQDEISGVTILTDTIMQLFRPELQERAFGQEGEAGDPVEIRHLAERWTGCYRRMLNWAAGVRGTALSTTFRPLANIVARMIDRPVQDYREFVDGFVAEVDTLPAWYAQPDREFRSLTPTLTLAVDSEVLAEFDVELARVQGELAIG